MSTTTNSSGFFQFSNVSVGPHTLQAIASGYTTANRGIVVVGGLNPPLSIRLCAVGSPICNAPGFQATAIAMVDWY